MHLDLNAKRAARAEALGEPHSFALGDDTFGLPHGIPLGLLELLQTMRIRDALALLLGGTEHADKAMLVHGIDHLDVLDVVREVYGIDLGEFLASAPSSKSTGEQSRRTSNGSTASTSRKRAGAKSR